MPIPPQKDRAPRASAKDRVYAALRGWIIDGTLQPGERLNDRELAEHFGVSRTPVREAIQMLADQKLIRVAPSSGTYVAPIDNEDMGHVYELLIALQLFAIDRAAETAGREDFDRLAVLNERFLHCVQSGTAAEASAADFAFHHGLSELSQNPYLIQFSDELALKAQRNENRFFKVYAQLYDSYKSHGRILDALCRGDTEAAREELKSNWRISLEKADP